MTTRLDLIRRMIEAFNADDFDRFASLCAEGVEIFPLRWQLEGIHYSGSEAPEAFWAAKQEAWETMTLEVEELREAGDGALLIATLRGRGRESGVEVALRSGWTFRFAGNSVTEIRMHPSVDAALERALGS